MDGSGSSSGSGSGGGVGKGSAAAAAVAAGAAAGGRNRDGSHNEQLQKQKQNQNQKQQQLQMRRLSYTTPATPFVGTPAGAPPDPDDDDDDDERNAQQRRHRQHVAVDSHLHLDDIRHPPHHSAAAAASASAVNHQSPHPPQQPQPQPTPQTRSSALLSAQYYASCALASIPPNLADRAVKSAHAAFKYWWDQDRIAERMVGEGDAEVTGVRVQARRGSESSDAQSSVTDLSATGGGGMMNHHSHHYRHAAGGGGGGGGGGTGAASAAGASAIRPQESFDEGSVASSMMKEAAAAAASAAAPIPMAIAVNNMSSPAQQRLGGGKRGRIQTMHSSSAHGDALWATDTEDEDNAAADGAAAANGGGEAGSARKRQKRTPVAGPALSPPQQQQIPARTEMVRSEMASFLKQQRYRSELQSTKTALLNALQITGGDVTTEPFLFALKRLRGLYKRSGLDCRSRVVSSSSPGVGLDETAGTATPQLEGMWLTLSRPNFHDCLGLNEQREYMYTLGRMSFGMYKPTNIVCSVQGTFNPIHRVDSADVDEVESVPRSLRKELHEGRSLLRTYNIVTAFSIEPASPLFGENSPNSTVTRPIRGIMTTYGYILPDPSTPNRLSVWFTGGTVEVDDEGDADEWKLIFGGSSAAAAANAGPMAPPRPGPSLSERAKMLAAKLLLGASVPHGMEEDGSMSFKLKRPVGGHGSTYVDTIYLDDTLRIMQGHHGSLFVMARVPGS